MLSILLLAVPSTETILPPGTYQHNLSSLLSEVPSTVRSSMITFFFFFFHFGCFLVLLKYSCFKMWCRFLSCLNMFQLTYIYSFLYLFLLLNGKSMHLMHDEAKQYWNSGVWNRDWIITGPCKEMSGSRLKNPKVTESFLQSRFQAKGEGGVWLATAEFLVSGPLLWRSGYGSGNAVSVNVCQMNLIFCPDKDRKVSRYQVAALTLQGPSPAWEEQSSAGGSLKARFPHPVQLSSLREPGPEDCILSSFCH